MDMKITKVLKVHFKIKAELYTVIVCILQTVSAITKKTSSNVSIYFRDKINQNF